MNKISKLQKVNLRKVWPREDANFTTWLEENIDHLTDALGFNIHIESREQPVGPFKVDLYGEDDDGRKVIVENQLEKTDHTHLGQVLTYLANLDAKVAVWISGDPVEEHRKAVAWLNETAPDDVAFYLVRVEAVTIGDNAPVAPLFTVVEKPGDTVKQIGAAKKDDAHRHTMHQKYWAHFLEKMNEQSDICQSLSPAKNSWLTVSFGVSGVYMYVMVTQKHVRTEIYIDTGDKERNKKIYDYLESKKDRIESDFGGELQWRRLEGNKASKVENWLHGVNVANEDDWEKITAFLTDSAMRMHAAFKTHISGLRAQNL